MSRTPFMRKRIPVCVPSSVRMMNIANAGSVGRRKRSVCMIGLRQVPEDSAGLLRSSQGDHLRLDLLIQGRPRRKLLLRGSSDGEEGIHQPRVELLDIYLTQNLIADGEETVDEHAVKEVVNLEPCRVHFGDL